jgi:hypothetical protein
MGLGINYVIRANHLVSLITSSTTDPWSLSMCFGKFLITKFDIWESKYVGKNEKFGNFE